MLSRQAWTAIALLTVIAGGCGYAALRVGDRGGSSPVPSILGALFGAVLAFIALTVFYRSRSQR